MKDRVEGTVYLAVTIAVDGTLQDARIDQVEPQASAGTLGAAALASVKSWRFDPARVDGWAIASESVVPVGFFLQDADAVLLRKGR